MENTNRNDLYLDNTDEIDLYEILNILWNRKLHIIGATLLFTLVSIIYALSLPNIYKSSAVLMPQEENSAMSGMLGQYSGMASLAGISMQSESTKSQEALHRINSFNFFSENLLPFISLQDLIAFPKWDSLNNKLTYDSTIFNAESGNWLVEVPSSQQAYETFSEVMSISEDKRTSLIYLSVQHVSPFIAQEWNELIINQIDLVMRDQDRLDAQRSIEFVNNKQLTTKYEGIKKTLSSLQQEQMKRLMMVEANKNYIFKVLDSPIVPERRSEPQRSFIVILWNTLGMLFIMLFSLALFFSRNKLKK
jgi:LPS O-antigen subunit length determinant protein (WzzB/FepE family)